MISGLTRFGGFKHAQAVGTSLPNQIVTNGIAGSVFAHAGLVDPVAFLLMAIPSACGAQLGVRIGTKMSERVYKGVFGLVLFAASPLIACASVKKSSSSNVDDDETLIKRSTRASWRPGALYDDLLSRDRMSTMCMSLMGLCVGILSGSMGIGATPALISYMTLFPTEYTYQCYKTCIGTSLCCVTVTASSGFLGHSSAGQVHWRFMPLLIVGSAVGGAVGSALALDLPSELLQLIFATFCGLYGFGVVRRTLVRPIGTWLK